MNSTVRIVDVDTCEIIIDVGDKIDRDMVSWLNSYVNSYHHSIMIILRYSQCYDRIDLYVTELKSIDHILKRFRLLEAKHE